MDDYTLLIDLHKQGHRQGPGGDAETELAIKLAMIDQTAPLKIADIGCGTGASTLVLARLLNAQITAVDFLQDFIDVLMNRAQSNGVDEKITPLCASMEQLPFEDEEFDVIWSEGAIYNIGFEKGLTEWRRFLKPGGVLVVSEVTWLTDSRPAELQEHWDSEYPDDFSNAGHEAGLIYGQACGSQEDRSSKESIMSIITISRGSYSWGKEIAEKVASKMGYDCISREILIEASKEFNIPEIKLVRALHDAPSALERFTHGRARYLSQIRKSLLQRLRHDNVVYHG
ncbi:MAG: methyltransferase domain-containing protein, partial [Desulfonatronovibrio sp.]